MFLLITQKNSNNKILQSKKIFMSEHRTYFPSMINIDLEPNKTWSSTIKFIREN